MTDDLNAGASASSDLDALIEGAAAAPMPEITERSPSDANEHRDPSEALRAAVDDGNAAREQDQGHRVPLSELLSERDKRQEYERRVRAFEAAEARRREDEERAGQQVPDQFMDPDAYTRFLREETNRQVSELRREAQQERLNDRLDAASDKHGREAVNAAYQALAETGDEALAGHFMSQRNPYSAMVEWHKNQGVLKEIGSDPAAYREKQLDEALKDPAFLQRAQEAIQAQAAQSPGFAPSPRARMPSLARAGTAAPASGGDAGITDAASAFGGR